MARNRTKEEILDQAVYAAATVARFYGPGFNQEGLAHLRLVLSSLPWSCDASYLTDVEEGPVRRLSYTSCPSSPLLRYANRRGSRTVEDDR